MPKGVQNLWLLSPIQLENFDGVFQSRPLPLMRSSELFKTLYLQTPLLQLGIQTSLEHAW
jgi:hypothetical protein